MKITKELQRKGIQQKDHTGQAFGDIYAFAFSLMLSNIITGSPMIGGTFYLCGSTGSSLFGNKEAKSLLTKKQYIFNTAAYCTLLIIDLLLIFYYPFDIQVEKVWTVFTVQLTIFLSDFVVRIMEYRFSVNSKEHRWRYALALSVFALTGSVIILIECPDNRLLACAYLVMFALHEYEHLLKHSNDRIHWDDKTIIAVRSDYRHGYAYRLLELSSAFIMVSACLSIILVYCSLSMTSNQVVIAMSIAMICMVLSALSARMYMTRKRSQNRLQASSLVLWGLVFWMIGLFIYCNNTVSQIKAVWKVFAGMALCSYGISLTLYCLEDVNRTIQLSTKLYAAQDADIYMVTSQAQIDTILLISELVTLLFLTFPVTLSGKSYWNNIEYAEHLQPFMLVPAVILIFAAFVTLLIFPVNNRYAHKLNRLLDLQSKGKNNKALSNEVQRVFVQKRKRPVGTTIIKALMRPFFRHKILGREKIVEDDNNPIVFLCNHSEIYGPLASIINLPVFVRPWVISDIVINPEEFAVYFNRYTLSQIKWIPNAWKMSIARLFGKVSVWGMNQLDSIPVFRNTPVKLIFTLRQTIDAMESGDNILIFPENPNADQEHPGYVTEGVGPLFDGFVLLADAYFRKTKKCCRFLPIFASKDTWTISIGDEIRFDPEANSQKERERISSEVLSQMQAMYQRQREVKAHHAGKETKRTEASK